MLRVYDSADFPLTVRSPIRGYDLDCRLTGIDLVGRLAVFGRSLPAVVDLLPIESLVVEDAGIEHVTEHATNHRLILIDEVFYFLPGTVKTIELLGF